MPKDSRAKIIAAARRAFYERGYDHTSFADVAKVSGVPKGNFYYHFQSKTELIQAVLDARKADIRAALASWSASIPSPKKRLERFARMVTSETEDLVRFGCPVGSLLTELGKQSGDAPHAGALALLDLYIAWASEQFAELGHSARAARTLAERLLSRCQGAIVIAHAYGDGAILRRELRDIERWLEEVGKSEPQG